MSLIRICVIGLIFSFGIEICSGEGRIRRWTDVQGRKIEAKLVGYSNGMVQLERKDGQQFAFPIDKLRARDQEYVHQNAPIDLKTASSHIDKLVWEGLKKANQDIKIMKQEVRDNMDLEAIDKRKEMARLDHMEIMTHPTKPLDDEKFLRRVYLDIAGRIPTHNEANRFLRNRSSNKRDVLIDELLNSEAFVSHFFNYLSDLLRVRDGISMGGFDNLKSQAYVDWVKDQVRQDRPWDEFVTDLLEARGYLWETPAVGYLLTDIGMELCNLSNTFTTFAGTEITCAQCHDHPFEDVYQIDFYRMAAFFGNLKYDVRDQSMMKTLGRKKKEFAAAAKLKEENVNDINNILSAYEIRLGDGMKSRVKLPFDYQYDNGEPNGNVLPNVYFGDPVDIEGAGGPRDAFAEWMTSKTNPRFTINIANRLWKHVFGIAQIEPVDNIPGHLEGQAQNYELLKYLESLMKEVDYSVKDFLTVLYKTRTYQSEACYKSPTLTMIDRGEFHFPAPILRRMSAEQLWDSFVSMSVDQPESADRQSRVLEAYREVMNVDWASVSYDEAKKLKVRYDKMGSTNMMMGDKKNKGPKMLRSSELPLPNRGGTFLFSFGQSDKRFIENGSKDGTIPQVMELLNGAFTNKVMSAENREMVRLAQAGDRGVDVIFLSILSRRPQPREREFAENLVRTAEGKPDDYSDLIWALLNTREFMFIQ